MTAAMEFPAASVLQHAVAVSKASEQMAQARAAVRTVSVDTQAYGQLCQFLPGLLSPLFGSAAEVMNEAVDALTETALKLRATAMAMDSTDAGTANRLDNAGGPNLALPL
ncbi:hypothetical protein GCM10010172_16160 [Paractinoplanes ferrugineus]|uniref:ESX-1 secretion-associated protein n=1 Tax=Paractinoplanes ferrugineus TaxID=113564 RepID=A0A919IWG4_9ACTN|nr:hypothetical protein [Actinoplanes ferrugineus]GIE10180.1 hypothetical protein Afe05nite_20200 [Actinoplanes ferrugineus]